MKFTTRKTSVEEATQTINEHWAKNQDDPYRPLYHPIAPHGWMNDPNGLIFKDGYYHIFYQWNPYGSTWGNMHWGHMRSRDLHNWDHLPVALAPEEIYEKDGCFSGSALEIEGKIVLFYTANIFENGEHPYNAGPLALQTQAIAVSHDDLSFQKLHDNPIINHVPEGGTLVDFRDPKVFDRGSYFEMILGIRYDDTGALVRYRTKDRLDYRNWYYDGQIAQSDGCLGYMWECPDLIECDDQRILIVSPMGAKAFNGKNITGYIFESEEGVFKSEDFCPMDGMPNFYAPQTFSGLEENLMVGWVIMPQMDTETHNWNGCLTLPQIIGIDQDQKMTRQVKLPESAFGLCKFEAKECLLAKSNAMKFEGDSLCIKGRLKPKMDGKIIFKLKSSESGDQYTELCIDFENKSLVMDTRQSGAVVRNKNIEAFGSSSFKNIDLSDGLDFDIYIDKSVIEVFLLNGKCLVTTAVFSNPDNIYTIIESQGGDAMFNYIRVNEMKPSTYTKAFE